MNLSGAEVNKCHHWWKCIELSFICLSVSFLAAGSKPFLLNSVKSTYFNSSLSSDGFLNI